MTKRIMCFGDSLTWGWTPIESGIPVERYSKEKRWTGILASELGPEYEVLEEGLSGRTTNLDDPIDPRLNGANYLPSALASHLPLDLVVLMLGTNDTKSYFHRSPFEIKAAVSTLIGQIAYSAGGVGMRIRLALPSGAGTGVPIRGRCLSQLGASGGPASERSG